jgi:hypothetical protein
MAVGKGAVQDEVYGTVAFDVGNEVVESSVDALDVTERNGPAELMCLCNHAGQSGFGVLTEVVLHAVRA